MARADSTNLRERAVAAAQAGDLTREEVAERFGISEATLYAWLRRHARRARSSRARRAAGSSS